MTAKELKETLENVPDDADVYIDAYASDDADMYIDAYASGRANGTKAIYNDEDNSFELY